eukprot:scaffold110225_cov41-Phaeocystis_antarctica.AAC.2
MPRAPRAVRAARGRAACGRSSAAAVASWRSGEARGRPPARTRPRPGRPTSLAARSASSCCRSRRARPAGSRARGGRARARVVRRTGRSARGEAGSGSRTAPAGRPPRPHLDRVARLRTSSSGRHQTRCQYGPIAARQGGPPPPADRCRARRT